jgi:hypothetical protein
MKTATPIPRMTPTLALFALVAGVTLAGLPSTVAGQATDPRVGLRAGLNDAAQAAKNLELIGHVARSAGFIDTSNVGDFGLINSDLAFKGNYVFQGSFHGFQVWDVSNPSSPKLRTSFACPGGQGDPSTYKNLLFMSVEETSGRVDCGTQGVQDTVSKERFRGVRIFDITDLDHPKQVAAVQTCRGSHTHTLVTDPKDTKNIYVYVSGTSVVRSPSELAGCSKQAPENDPNTSLFRIDVIQVPLAAPENAKIVSSPRVFADSAGHIAGLWKGGSHGEGTQSTNQTDQCHDITVYTAIGLAAGACSGNGILLDIRDASKPKRIAAVSDPNFAYWHSATFSNDGKKVIFSDEWGGGVAPRCRTTDKPEWCAVAIFTLKNGYLSSAGYYKLPAPQTEFENCVAHNGSLIPIPGRDIMAQAWYQGGISVFDFTNPSHPVEIAYFDRGPMDASKLILSGFWSAYWYNGHIYGSEIGRGLDLFDLKPSEYLSQNEIDAAKLIHFDFLNVQDQPKLVWPASFSVPRAYLDQLGRNNGLASDRASRITSALDAAEKLKGAAQRAALSKLATQIDANVSGAADAARVRALAAAVRDLAKAKS